MKNLFARGLGAILILVFSLVLLPLVCFFYIFRIGFGTNLLVNLGFFVSLLYILGCGLILFIKLTEYYEEFLISRAKNHWYASQEFVIYKISPAPKDLEGILNMNAFYKDLSSINGDLIGIDELLKDKVWYLDINFEIHASNGEKSLYAIVSNHIDTFFTQTFQKNFPDTGLTLINDPLGYFPDKWYTGGTFEEFSQLTGFEFELKKADLFPLKNYQKNLADNWVKNDGLNDVWHDLDKLKPETYTVIQFLFRPIKEVKLKEWKADLDNLQKKLVEKNKEEFSQKIDSIGKQKVLDSQKDMINGCELKISDPQFQTHIRWFMLYNEELSESVQSLHQSLAGYINFTKTPFQELQINEATNTETKFAPTKLEFFNKIISKPGEIFWWNRKLESRKNKLYQSIVNRDFEAGPDNSNFFLDTYSLTTVFHLPVIQSAPVKQETVILERIVEKIEIPTSQVSFINKTNFETKTADAVKNPEAVNTSESKTSTDGAVIDSTPIASNPAETQQTKEAEKVVADQAQEAIEKSETTETKTEPTEDKKEAETQTTPDSDSTAADPRESLQRLYKNKTIKEPQAKIYDGRV